LEAAGKSKEEPIILIIQKWNGYRPKMPLEILTDFKGYMTNLKLQELQQKQNQ
jgi:hypothetical protein